MALTQEQQEVIRQRIKNQKNNVSNIFSLTDKEKENYSTATKETIDKIEPLNVDNPVAFAFKLGVTDTLRGVKQIAGADEEQMKAEQKYLNELMRGPDGGKVTAAYFAGAIIDPASWLIPFGKARNLLSMGKYGMVSGAIAGAAGYVDTEEGLFKTRGQQILGSAVGGGVLAPTVGGLFNLGVKVTGKGNRIPLTAKRESLTPAETVNRKLTKVQTYGKLDEDSPAEDIKTFREQGKIYAEGDVELTKRPESEIGKEVTPIFARIINALRGKTPEERPFGKIETVPDRPTPGVFTGFYGLQRKATGFLEDIFENYEKNVGKRILAGAKTAEGGGALAGGILGFTAESDEPLSTRFGLAVMGAVAGGLVGRGVKKREFTKRVKINVDGKEEVVEIKQTFADLLGRLFIDKYGLSQNYKDLLNRYDGELHDIAGQFIKLAKKAEDLNENERKILFNMLEGDIKYPIDPVFIGAPPPRSIRDRQISPKIAELKEEIRALITEHGQRYVDLGMITQETFNRNKDIYLARVYKKYASELIKVGDELKPRGLLSDDVYTAEEFLKKLRFAEPTINDVKLLKAEGVDHRGWELFGDYALVNMTRTKKKGRIVEEIQSEDIKGKEGNVIVKVLRRDPPTETDVRLGQKGKIVKWKTVKPNEKISVRWQYTKPERKALGEIEDAAIIVEYTGQVLANSIAKYGFFANVAKNFGKVAKGVTEEITKNSRKFYDEVTDSEIESGLYKQIPKTILRGTKQQSFGKLGGKYVPVEIYNDIIAGARYQALPSNAFYKTYRKMNSVWKLSKTAWNPTVHVNNIFGNIFLSDLANVPISTIPETIRIMFNHSKKGKESQIVRDAISYGVFDNDFVRKELKNFNVEDMARIYATKEGANEWSKSVSIANNLYRQVLNNKVTGTLERWYRVEDHIFRLNAFIHRIRKGDTYQEAAAFARKQFIDYDIDAPVINHLRHTAVPFLSFTYRMIPLLVEASILRPQKFFKYAAIGYGLTKMEEMYGGPDAKKERALLPEYEAGSILDLPFMPKKTIRIPVKDKNGRPKFLNISRLFPGGDITNFSGQNIVPFLPEPLQPNFGIGGDVLSSLFGFDIFTRRVDPNRFTEGPLQETGKALGTLAKKLIPNFPFVPGAYSTKKLNRALLGDDSPFREPQSEFEALLNAFGFKVSNKSLDTLSRRAKLELDKKVRIKQSKLRQLKRELNSKTMNRADFDRQTSKVQNDIYDLIKEYNLRLEGYDPYGVRIFDDVTHTMGSGSTSNEVFENQISDSVKRQIEKLKQKR